MKNKADREYKFLYVSTLAFSVVVPILIYFFQRYVSAHHIDLFGKYPKLSTSFNVFHTVINRISDVTYAIANSFIIILAIRYKFKPFMISIIPLTLSNIILYGFQAHSFIRAFDGTQNSNIVNKDWFLSNIILMLLMILIPFLCFIISRLMGKLIVSESKCFLLTSCIVLLISKLLAPVIYLISILQIQLFGDSLSIIDLINGIISVIISFPVMIAAYFLIKLLLDKIKKPIQAEVSASE